MIEPASYVGQISSLDLLPRTYLLTIISLNTFVQYTTGTLVGSIHGQDTSNMKTILPAESGQVFKKRLVCFLYKEDVSASRLLCEHCDITDFGKTISMSRHESHAVLTIFWTSDRNILLYCQAHAIFLVFPCCVGIFPDMLTGDCIFEDTKRRHSESESFQCV